mgnify:CR=1 FL=1
MELTLAMMDTLIESIQEIKAGITDVVSGDLEDDVDTVLFKYQGRPYKGYLKGRNAEVVVGVSPEADKAIALRVWIDGHASPI